MSIRPSAQPAPVTAPVTWSFVLTVQPLSAQQPWQARLSSTDGAQLDFDTPIELLRHLAQLGAPGRTPGGLK